jgi:hypothetical protein
MSPRLIEALLMIATAAACSAVAPERVDVCEAARVRFSECGASLPLLTNKPCTGVTRAVSACIVHHVSNCDELASLTTRIDLCVADEADGGELPPAEDLIPPMLSDAGTNPWREDTSNPRSDAGADAAVPVPDPVDAGTPRDAGADATVVADAAAAWTFPAASGVVNAGAYARYATQLLRPGTYEFNITGDNNADLYLRKDAAPSVTAFDCRSTKLDSNEVCRIQLAAPAIIHIGVRGVASRSRYQLQGTEVP